MKILMLNDYMDSPDAHWRGAQVQTRRLAKALGASINGGPWGGSDKAFYPMGCWDVANFQDNRSIFRLTVDGTIKVATVRHFDPAPNLETIDRYNEMDGIIAISYFVKDELVKKGVIERKIRVIPPCIELFDTPLDYMKRNTFAITFAGAVEESKGIFTLIEAMRLMSHYKSKYHIPGVSLHVAGLGRDLWKAKSLADYLPVFFHGLRSIERTRIMIKSSDVFVLPSLQEAFGSVLLEAMMVETLIIASDVGGIPEVVQHKREGTLVPPGDAESLAQSIYCVSRDHWEYERKAVKAKHKALKYYTVGRVANLTEEYYKELLEVKQG